MTDDAPLTSVPGLEVKHPASPGPEPGPEPGGSDEHDTPPVRRGARGRSTHWSFAGVALVLAGAIVVASRSDASPVGGEPTDTVLTVAYAVALTLAGTRARSRALVVFAGCAVVAAAPEGGMVAAVLALALAATALLMPAVRSGGWRAPVGALAAALAACSFLEGTELRAGWAVGLGAIGSLVALVSARAGSPRRVRHTATVAFVVVVLLALAAAAAFGAAAYGAKNDATEGIDRLKAGLDAAKDGDVDRARDELRAARDAMQHADHTLSRSWAQGARHVPVLGQNARAVGDLASLASNLAEIATRAADSANLDAIASDAGSVDLAQVHDVSAALDELEAAVNDARTRLAAIDSPWLAGPLVDKLDEARTELDDAAPSIANAREAASVLPVLLGEGTGARYLVLFGTPVEARGRTGFPGNWAEVIAIDGQVRMTRFGRLIELNDVGVDRRDRELTGLDDYLTHYGRFLPQQYWQNVPMSPDVPTVAQAAAQLYPQSGGGKIDGVLFIDVEGIIKLLELSGPVKVDLIDEELTASNALDLLLRRQYIDLPTDERVGFLGQVAQATLRKLTSQQLPGVRTMSLVLGDAAAKGHIRFVSFDDRVSPLLARNRLDGALGPVDGDDVMLLTNNAAGNKIDLFLRRTFTYDVRWNPTTGAVDGTLTVQLHNGAPEAGLPKALIGNALDNARPFFGIPASGTNRMWLSVYSAFVPDRVTLEGAPALAEFDREAGRSVTSMLVDVPANSTRTLVLHWTGAVAPGARYGVGLPAQPLVRPDEATVRVTVEGTDAPRTYDATATLDRDRRIEVANG